MRVFVLIILFLLSGCESKDSDNLIKSFPETLSDLSYDTGGTRCVYLQESDLYVPYLVLTDNYRGNCLLLRKYLLDEPKIYNNPGKKASYYEESYIDCFLNEEFIWVYPEVLQQYIVETDIEITAKESIGHCGKETSTIQRKLFLLSYTELNGTSSRTILQEGSPLLYFTDRQNRIAYYETGKPGSWWLRSASTAGTTYVCGVSTEGVMGSGGIYNPNPGGGYFSGVRPALCLPGNLSLYQIEEGYTVVPR